LFFYISFAVFAVSYTSQRDVLRQVGPTNGLREMW